MKGIRRVSTRNMSRPEWLARRRNTIGGSDAAAIVGLSRYGSQYSVFMDKTGRLPDKPDTEAMRQGRDLEEYVSQRFGEETGKKVRRLQAMLYNPLYPFAHADVDRMVCGEDAGLECKTTSTLDVSPVTRSRTLCRTRPQPASLICWIRWNPKWGQTDSARFSKA